MENSTEIEALKSHIAILRDVLKEARFMVDSCFTSEIDEALSKTKPHIVSGLNDGDESVDSLAIATDCLSRHNRGLSPDNLQLAKANLRIAPMSNEETEKLSHDELVLDVYQIAQLAESVGLTVQSSNTDEDFWSAECILAENFTLIDEDTGDRELVDMAFWFREYKEEGAIQLDKFFEGADVSGWSAGSLDLKSTTPT